MSAANEAAVAQKRHAQHQDRWSASSSNAAIEWSSGPLTPAALKEYEIFQPYSDKVLEKISTDIRVARWKPGSVLFEEGAYIDMAFFVVRGEVDISVEKLDGMKASAAPIFDADRTQLNVMRPEASQPAAGPQGHRHPNQQGEDPARRLAHGASSPCVKSLARGETGIT